MQIHLSVSFYSVCVPSAKIQQQPAKERNRLTACQYGNRFIFDSAHCSFSACMCTCKPLMCTPKKRNDVYRVRLIEQIIFHMHFLEKLS